MGTARRWLTVLLLAVLSLVAMAAPIAHAAGPLTFLGSVPLAAMAHDILIEGNLAYVATDAGLTILDLTDPVHPIVRGSALAPDKCQGLAKKGSHVYLAAATGGMQVVDVSHPDAPQTIANAKAGWQGGNIWDVAVHPTANAAYAASFDGELYVWNATPDPLHLTFAHTHRTPVMMRVEADASRGWVFMLSTYDKPSGLYTSPYSLMNPFAATRWDKCAVCGFEKAGIRMDQGGLAISPNGRYVVYAGGRDTGQLRIMDVANPSDPLTVHVEPLGLHKLGLAEAMGVAFHDDIMYVAAGALGVRVYSFPGLAQ